MIFLRKIVETTERAHPDLLGLVLAPGEAIHSAYLFQQREMRENFSTSSHKRKGHAHISRFGRPSQNRSSTIESLDGGNSVPLFFLQIEFGPR